MWLCCAPHKHDTQRPDAHKRSILMIYRCGPASILSKRIRYPVSITHSHRADTEAHDVTTKQHTTRCRICAFGQSHPQSDFGAQCAVLSLVRAACAACGTYYARRARACNHNAPCTWSLSVPRGVLTIAAPTTRRNRAALCTAGGATTAVRSNYMAYHQSGCCR